MIISAGIAHHSANMKNWWGYSGNAKQRRKRRRAATNRKERYLASKKVRRKEVPAK